MSELIRDCDKIDIYRSVEKYVARQPLPEYMRTEGIKDSSPEITDEVFANVMNCENVLLSSRKTVGDHAAYYMN